MIIESKVKESMHLLGLDGEKYLNEQVVKSKYRKLASKYHPDVCEEIYKDGEMFKKINEASSYLIDNLDEVNKYLADPIKYNEENVNYNYGYEGYQNTNQGFYRSYNFKTEDSNRSPSFFVYFLSFMIPFFGFINGMLYRMFNKKASRICFLMMILGFFVQTILPFMLK